MSRWFEEVRLARHPIAEIGVAFYIREILGNECVVNEWDLKEIFGENCERYLENLRRAGMLEIERIGHQIKLRIIASGDKKRQRCKALVRRRRHMKDQK